MDLQHTCDVGETEYVRFLDSFASAPGAALAYHYPFYLRFLTDVAYPGSRVHFSVAREAGRLVGVLPWMELRTAHLHVALSLAYFGPNAGAIVAPDASGRGAVTSALVAAAAADARALGCGSMTIYTALGETVDPYIDGLSGVDFRVPRFSQWLVIPDDASASPWPAKVRYYVRRAAARGVVARPIADENELDIVWDMYRERCLERGIPVKPRDHVRALFRAAGDRGILLAAEQGGRIVGGLICFLGGGVISYYLPVAHPDVRPLRPALLLLDEAVAIGRRAGGRRLNFEGSPSVEHPVYRFKAECGGVPVSYEVIVKLLQPGILDAYRALTPSGLTREAPQAFIVPFNDLAH